MAAKSFNNTLDEGRLNSHTRPRGFAKRKRRLIIRNQIRGSRYIYVYSWYGKMGQRRRHHVRDLYMRIYIRIKHDILILINPVYYLYIYIISGCVGLRA